MKKIRIGFDIGGVIGKYTQEFAALMQACAQSPVFEVYVITDMPRSLASRALSANSIPFEDDHLLCADFAKHGDLCKAVLMEEHSIDMMIDDRPDYITEGVRIGLCVMPRPRIPYIHPDWKMVPE
jgi:hypothetical protein